MGARIAWTGGGEAELVKLDGERVEVVSSRPFPPGSRPDGALDGGAAIQLKVHGAKREDDGRFRVHGRLINATRALRETLEASLAG